MTNNALVTWIAGLMRENYEAVGFLPFSALDREYISNDRYLLQLDDRGKRVGYLLHGAPVYGRPLVVTQHCIQYEFRNRGHGESALGSLVARAEQAGCSGILARCATELESLGFWMGQGFRLQGTSPGGARRQREISRLYLPLGLPLLDGLDPIP